MKEHGSTRPPPPYKPHSGAVQPTPQQFAYHDPYQQQPITHQPVQHHNTTIVIAGHGGFASPQIQPQQMRKWSTGVCGCCEDPCGCLCVMCCPECYGCHLASKAGETCCLPCCVPAWMIALRAHIRGKHNIEGSICDDCLMVTCCYPCTMCQLSREINNINKGIAPR